MKFKVGQRVKRIRVICTSVPIGSEGTVIRGTYFKGMEGEFCHVKWDKRDLPLDAEWLCSTLAPLTDPGFESFMERIQKPLTKPEWEAA